MLCLPVCVTRGRACAEKSMSKKMNSGSETWAEHETKPIGEQPAAPSSVQLPQSLSSTSMKHTSHNEIVRKKENLASPGLAEEAGAGKASLMAALERATPARQTESMPASTRAFVAREAAALSEVPADEKEKELAQAGLASDLAGHASIVAEDARAGGMPLEAVQYDPSMAVPLSVARAACGRRGQDGRADRAPLPGSR